MSVPVPPAGGGVPPQSPQQQATALLSQIPLGAIIGSPLKAAVDAQAAAAVACYDFVRNVGFEEVAQEGNKPAYTKVREITFRFERKVTSAGADGGAAVAPATQQVSITVPLLTVMPLPFIRIESMTVNFKASISASDERSATQASSTNGELKGEAQLGFAWWKVNVSGGISSKKDSTATNTSKYSVEHTMDVSLHAVQDDMPAGLAKILSIMTDSIAVSR